MEKKTPLAVGTYLLYIRKYSSILFALTISLGILFSLIAPAISIAATTPNTIGYQGYIQQSGSPVNGTENFTFALYSATSGGSPLWTETQNNVQVNGGYFSVSLGTQTPFPSTLDFSQSYYLEVTINGTTLAPRQSLDAVPFAHVAYGVVQSTTAPAAPSNGSTYFNPTGSGTFYVYDANTGWTALATTTTSGASTTPTIVNLATGVTGTLPAANGGTGLAGSVGLGILVGDGNGGWTQVATSSLGLTTTNVAEGTNLYFTNARADNRFATDLAATTTNALAEGSANLYFTNARADARIALATSLPDLQTLPGLTLTGTINANGNSITGVPTPVNPTDAANKSYVDTFVQGLTWQAPVIALGSTTPPVSPNTGDRYVVGNSATGAWIGEDRTIATWTGSAWSFLTPSRGYTLFVTNISAQYNYNGTSWVPIGSGTNFSALTGIAATSQGGTGIASGPLQGQLLLGNSSGGYSLVATSSLGFVTPNGVASILAGTTTDAIPQGITNLYYSNALARAALSSVALGLSYASTTGQFSLASGYTIPTIASTTAWNNGISPWTVNTGNIQYNGGVGIGTTNPTAGSLALSGGITANGNILTSPAGSSTSSPRVFGFSPTYGTGQAAQFEFGSTGNVIQNAYYDRMQIESYWGLEIRGNQESLSPQFVSGYATDAALSLYGSTGNSTNILNINNNGGTTLDVVTATGQLGIGTTTPSAALAVGGNALIGGSLTATGGLSVNGAINDTSTATSTLAGGTNITSGCYAINGVCLSSSSGGVSQFTTSGSNTYLASGNLGVDTATPQYPLDVSGTVNAGSYFESGQLLAYASTTSGDALLGMGALANIGTSSLPASETAIGINALNANQGNYNTAIGNDAMKSGQFVSYDTAVGYKSLYNGGGFSGFNDAFGYESQYDNTGGSGNASFGEDALYANSSGSNNVALGYDTLQNDTNANNTVAIGATAGSGFSNYSNIGGTYVGFNSGEQLQTGSDYNTLLGFDSGYGITTGSNNIVIGAASSSANNLTTGSQNILIGASAALPSATGNGQLNIGNFIYGKGLTGTGSTISSGSIGIGTTTPGATLAVNGNALVAGALATMGGLSVTGTTTTGSLSTGALALSGPLTDTNTATSTLAGGTNITSGCYAVNGVCLTSGTNGITASGVAGIIAATTTDALAQGTTNLYYSNALARNAISSNALGLTYASTTGQLALTSGYTIPTTASTTAWNNGISQWTTNGSTINYSGGNVGIGTSTPGALLAVGGNALIGGALTTTGGLSINGAITDASVATSTFAGGTNITSGCYAVNGVCLTSGTGGGALTGTTGQLAYFNGTNTAVGTSTINIATNGNVGIGTTSPSFGLVVSSSGVNSGFGLAQEELAGSSTETGLYFLNTSTGGRGYNIISTGGSSGIGAGNFAIVDVASTTSRFEITAAGNVGISSTTPGSLFAIGTTNGINFSTATSTFNSTGGVNLASGCYAVGGNCLNLSQWTNSGTGMYFNRGGDVAIGTTTPGDSVDLTLYDPSDSADIFHVRSGNDFLYEGAYASNGQYGSLGAYSYTAGALPLELEQAGGNVGISTQPASGYKLDVNGGGANAHMRLLSGSTSAFSEFDIGRTGNDASIDVADGNGNFSSDAVAGDLILRDDANGHILFNNNSGGGASTMDIINGHVSVNTSSNDGSYLEVYGSNDTADTFHVRNGNTYIYEGSASSNPYAVIGAYNSSTNGAVPLELQSQGGFVGIQANTTYDSDKLAINSTSGYTNGIGININSGSTGIEIFNNSGTGSYNGVSFFKNGSNSVGGITVSQTSIVYGTGSDARIKQNIATTTDSLADLMGIQVADFEFKSDPSQQQTGFIAQNLENIFPEAVTTNGDNGLVPLGASSTPWTVDYGRVTPLIVKAVQDIANISSTFETNLVAWLGSAANGIHDIYTNTSHQETLCVGSAADGGETCITKAQLDQLLQREDLSPASSGSVSASASDTSNTSNTSNTSGASSTASTTDSTQTSATSASSTSVTASSSTSTPSSSSDSSSSTATPPSNPSDAPTSGASADSSPAQSTTSSNDSDSSSSSSVTTDTATPAPTSTPSPAPDTTTPSTTTAGTSDTASISTAPAGTSSTPAPVVPTTPVSDTSGASSS